MKAVLFYLACFPQNREENFIMKTTNKGTYHQINERRERIGNTTFLVRSHFNPMATESPEQLLLKLLESKIKNNQNKKEKAA
jgi:recombinational DNA repair protein RecR